MVNSSKMPRCNRCNRNIRFRTKSGLCNYCYYGRNRASGGILGSFFEGETGQALERTPLSVMAIIILLVVGIFSFIGNWFDSRLVSALIIAIGVFWIYQKNKENKKSMRKTKKILFFLFVIAVVLIIVFFINFFKKYDISSQNTQVNEIAQEFCENECQNACDEVYKASTTNLHAGGRGCMCDCMDGKVVLIDEYGNYR